METREPTLDAIARPTGTLAMVAMDQRESLTTMFAQSSRSEAARGRPDASVIRRFKLDVAEVLGPLASGFLIDREFGYPAVRDSSAIQESTGLILAADALTQDQGGPVEETALDEVVVAPAFDLAGVSALKLLIIWRRDSRRAERVELARRFIAESARLGLLSVLEPVVRATPAELEDGPWDQDAAIREAARELSPLRPSLYKTQVPLGGSGSLAELTAASADLGRAITGPWVVLSQGVALIDFPRAVEAACRGGASGFLAGRALWSDIVGAADVPAELRAVSAPRLERLVETVDREARPWTEA